MSGQIRKINWTSLFPANRSRGGCNFWHFPRKLLKRRFNASNKPTVRCGAVELEGSKSTGPCGSRRRYQIIYHEEAGWVPGAGVQTPTSYIKIVYCVTKY